MKNFLTSNSIACRLGRTILQGCIGVVIANLDVILMHVSYIPNIWRPIITALIIAILSPIMATLGKDTEENNNNGDDTSHS